MDGHPEFQPHSLRIHRHKILQLSLLGWTSQEGHKQQFNIVGGTDQKAYRSRPGRYRNMLIICTIRTILCAFFKKKKSAYRARSTWKLFFPTFAGWSKEVRIHSTTKATRCLDWSRSETLCWRFDPTCSFQSCDECHSADLKVLRQTTAWYHQDLKFATHFVLLANSCFGRHTGNYDYWQSFFSILAFLLVLGFLYYWFADNELLSLPNNQISSSALKEIYPIIIIITSSLR